MFRGKKVITEHQIQWGFQTHLPTGARLFSCWYEGVKGKEQSAYSFRKLFLSKKLVFITFIKARRGRTTAGLGRGVTQIPSLISAGAGVRAARSGRAVRRNRVKKSSLLPPRPRSRVCHRSSRVPVAVPRQVAAGEEPAAVAAFVPIPPEPEPTRRSQRQAEPPCHPCAAPGGCRPGCRRGGGCPSFVGRWCCGGG